MLLDLIVKSEAYDDTIFFIDEPELHLNTRLQAALLEVLLDLTPSAGQLWIATHSIGMMRRAQEMASANASSVAFIDFDDHDFDAAVTIAPSTPNRDFWSRVLDVALGDLASLVAPDRVVLCEGRPAGIMNTAKAEFDARCYRKIFGPEFPRTDFVSVGNAADAATDRVELGRTIQTLVSGTSVVRVVDRDLRSPAEINDLMATGTRVLGRRHLESYLLDDEVIARLCVEHGREDDTVAALACRDAAVSASVERGNDPDDLKSAAGDFYVRVRQLLGITGGGSTADAFLADTLAPLLQEGMETYAELRRDVLAL